MRSSIYAWWATSGLMPSKFVESLFNAVSQSVVRDDMSEAEPSRVFALDSRAMATLAHKTAVAIAWLLILPDTVGLLPNSPDVLSWFLKLLGLWISALVLWYVGFLGILHLVRLFGQGISTSEAGVKLWRFAKPIPWSQIEAVEIEPQEAFSKLFSLKPMASRLILFERPRNSFKIFGSRLIPHNIPSFLFSKEKFEELTASICRNALQTVPSAPNVLLVPATSLKKLRLVHKMMAGQRLLLTLLVAFGLLSLLGRKGFVNYSYNFGNKCLAQNQYAEARRRYQVALALDPAFAAGWCQLAVADYDLSDFAAAEKHWKKALLYKPDYVEAKYALAHMLIHQRKFNQARDLLESALNLAPLNATALLHRSDLNMCLGRYNDCVADARAALAQDDCTPAGRYMANCLLAKGKLKLGDARGALKVLAGLGPPVSPFDYGENGTLRLIVESQCLFAVHRQAEAETLARRVFTQSPDDPSALFNLLDMLLSRDNFQEAKLLAKVAEQKFPDSPYTYVPLCRIAIAEKKLPEAQAALDKLVASGNQDANSLADAAKLALALGRTEQALDLARRSLLIEPRTKAAQTILAKLNQEPTED